MSISRIFPIQLASLLCAVAACCATGCCLVPQVTWIEPTVVAPRADGKHHGARGLADAERLYARALADEEQGLDSCVDLFFKVAVLTANHQSCASRSCRGYLLHQSAVLKLVDTGQTFGRLDPRQGLTIRESGGQQLIPIGYHGFVWQPTDFHHLIAVGDYKAKALSTKHRRPGVGIPVVVQRCQRSGCTLLPNESHFAATLRLNVNPVESDSGDATIGCQLELYDPLRIDDMMIHGQRQPVAKDLTAPLAYGLRREGRAYLTDFLYTEASGEPSRLYLLEPYQAGKIPVVLIHGLLSDPYTWAELVNELRAHPGLVDRFQIWVFEYPTGQAFLSVAADLREQLAGARVTLDPTHSDLPLSSMVLIGHSMGGLIAKLQVTASGDHLWRAVANRPFDQVVMSDQTRQDLARSFFFEPSDFVSRVIFMATPHRGSNYARRLTGRFAASLVQVPEVQQQRHQQLIQSNPGVLSEEVSNRIPTSIDLLDPDSELLQAIDTLPISQRTCLHSVIGDHFGTLFHGRNDGVVPVSSAREHRAVTEIIVDAKHSKVKEVPESIAEVIRILYEQWQRTGETGHQVKAMTSPADSDCEFCLVRLESQAPL